MIVTDIVPVTKAKSKIYIDSSFAFVLYKGEIRFYKIRVNEELSFECYDEICEVLLPKRAKKRCLMLLQKRDYTEEQLRRKLKDGGYPFYAISEAIQYVKDYDYVNDARFCEAYIQCYCNSRSVQRMTMDLLKKGIEKVIIQDALEELLQRGELGSEEELIRNCLEKKHFNFNETDPKKKQKMISHLLYKGFSISNIMRVLGNSLDITSFNV